MRGLLWSAWYWLPGRRPWDTGVTPPEVERFLASTAPGHALDLGCGTGTNAAYLARHGWSVVGVDFAARAIAKARRACARCELHVADVTRLGFLDGPFDLALDIGCLHTLAAPARRRYAAGLSRLVRPAGTYLLYAFAPGGPAVGVSRADVAATFADAFELVSVEEGRGRPSAWYTLVRR